MLIRARPPVGRGFFVAGKEVIMKVQDFAYQVAARTLALLEATQHYKIPDELRKSVLGKIQEELGDLIAKSK